MIFSNKLLLYIWLPMYDLLILSDTFPFVIGVTHEISANAKYVMISPSIKPYIIPPNFFSLYYITSVGLHNII